LEKVENWEKFLGRGVVEHGKRSDRCVKEMKQE